MIDILLVDDYAAVRAGLRMLLSLEPDLHIVGEARDGVNAIQLAKDLCPKLIIMDVNMPDMDGITAAARLKNELAQSEIIILTAEDTLNVHERAKAAGVAAVMPKDNRIDQLIAVIHKIMSPRMAQMAMT